MMKKIVLLLVALVAIAGCSSSGGGRGGGASGGAPSSPAPTGGGTSTQAVTPHPSSSTPTVHSSQPPVALSHFRVADLTWVGTHGWALGEADCLSGSGQCDAIEQTANGSTWTSLPAPKAQTYLGESSGCSGNCLNGLRFATDRIGYAYGPHALYLTTDGGRTWARQSGGAVALETLGGTVIRVAYPQGLPGSFTVQVSAVGSSTWSDVSLPGAPDMGFGSLLGRAAGTSYLLTLGHPAGGGNDARSMLYTSTDGGHTWTGGGEPCPQINGSTSGEVDSTAMTVAPDGSATVLCQRRISGGRPFTATASRGGSFHAGSRTALGSATVTGFGAASSSVIVIVLADTFRSTDGGQSFARLAADAGSSPGDPVYVAFSSTTVGHAISGDRRTVFTTTDAGRTWSAHRFS